MPVINSLRYLKKLLVLIVYLKCSFLANAQISALKVGDKMPNISLGKVIDNISNLQKVNDLTGKLIIFDFWNVHCKTCIANMPKMNSLQQKYNGRIQVIAVTYNTEEEVSRLFSRIKIKKPNFPFVVEDSILNALFPHQGDPLHVWVTPEGNVFAITFDYETNEETINSYLYKKLTKLTRRWDYGININYPLLSEQNSPLLQRTNNYSTLFSGLNEYSADNYILVKDTFIQVINGTMFQLFGIAYNNELYQSTVNQFLLGKNNRIQLEVKDPTRFYFPANELYQAEWNRINQFSYELKISQGQESNIHKLMQNDLLRFLPYSASIEKRTINCWVLTSPKPEKIPVSNNTHVSPFICLDEDGLVLCNQPISELLMQIIYANPTVNLPIVSEVDFLPHIDIILHSKLSDFKTLNVELARYGFQFVKKRKEISMLIIKDK